MRKIILGIFVLLIASSAKAQTPMAATDITATDVQAFIKGAPQDRNSDRPIRVVDAGGYRLGVFGVFRPKDAPITATVHQTAASETYVMLDGAGVLVTGGRGNPLSEIGRISAATALRAGCHDGSPRATWSLSPAASRTAGPAPKETLRI
jgi:hypothetical protein